MTLPSKLELIGSPVELASWSPATTYFWDPTPELAAGEVPASPTAKVFKYNPDYPNDGLDVTSAVLVGNATVGSGQHSNQVQIVIAAGSMTVGYAYRVELTCAGSGGTAATRFFVIVCKY